MPEPGGREAQNSPEQSKAQLDYIWGFLKRFVLVGCFLQGPACVAWMEKPGSEGVELRLLQSSSGAGVGDVRGSFSWSKQSWFYWDGRSWAEVPGGRIKCWQEELLEVNAGREGRV